MTTPPNLLGQVAKYGVGSVIGLYLVFQLAQNIPTILERLNIVAEAQGDIMQDHQSMLQIFDSLKMDLLREVKRSNEIQRRACENAANNEREFRNCTIPE